MHEPMTTSDLAYLVVVEPARVESIQGRGAWRELAQEEVLGREAPECREPAHGALEGPVRVRRAGADDGGARALVRDLDEAGEGVADEPGVGVQDQDVAAARLARCRCSSPRRGRGSPTRSAAPRGSGRARRRPCRRVEPLSTTTVCVAAHALEALLDPGQRVVRDDDDHDVRLGASHARPAGALLREALPRENDAAGERERDV